MERHKLYEEPTDFYEESEGDVMPPNSGVFNQSNNAKYRGEIVAQAMSHDVDAMSRHVTPSIEMDKAVKIAEVVLGIAGQEFTGRREREEEPVVDSSDNEPQEAEIEGTSEDSDEVIIAVVGKFGDRLRAEYKGRVKTVKIPQSTDTDTGFDDIKRKLEEEMRKGGGRRIPRKK